MHLLTNLIRENLIVMEIDSLKSTKWFLFDVGNNDYLCMDFHDFEINIYLHFSHSNSQTWMIKVNFFLNSHNLGLF